MTRVWESGGIRDESEHKPDIEAYFSPLVELRRAEFMLAKQYLPDGTKRAGDNWQKLFGETLLQHRSECMKSIKRHINSLWLIHRGHKAYERVTLYDKEGKPTGKYELKEQNLEDEVCALMFGLEAILHAHLKEKL